MTISTVPGQRPAPQHAASIDPKISWVLLTIRDDGPGVSAATLKHMFDPCFTTRPQRLGLGLSAAKGVMAQLGGLMEASSAPGEGCTLQLWLPQAEPAPPPTEEPSTTPRSLVAAASEKTVLLVEDEERLRQALGQLLTQRGYKILVAASYEQAIEQLLEWGRALDLLVTDVDLAGPGGVGLAHTLRTQQPTIPVLFLSGSIDAEQLRQAAPGPAWQLLTKPFSKERFLQSVGALMATQVDPPVRSVPSSHSRRGTGDHRG